jgi:tripeptidyl-peptidase-1
MKFSFVVFCVVASAVLGRRVPLEPSQRLGVPAGWSVHPVPPSRTEKLVFPVFLTPKNAEALERVATEVSTPGHPNYGRHLTLQDIQAIVAPEPHVYHAVASWLRSSNFECEPIKTGYLYYFVLWFYFFIK